MKNIVILALSLVLELSFTNLETQASSSVMQLRWIAGNAGEKDYLTVSERDGIQNYFWSEPAVINGEKSARYRIYSATYNDVNSKMISSPHIFLDRQFHHWGPSVLSIGEKDFLTYYASFLNSLTGDRDIFLVAFDKFFKNEIYSSRLTRDAKNIAHPYNDAMPSLAQNHEPQSLIEVHSSGIFYGEGAPISAELSKHPNYIDKNIIAQLIDFQTGKVTQKFNLTDGNEVGWEMDPNVATIPGESGYVVYQTAPLIFKRKDGTRVRPYHLKLNKYSLDWKTIIKSCEVSLSDPTAELRSAKILIIENNIYLAAIDGTHNDIVLFKLTSDLKIIGQLSLRTELKAKSVSWSNKVLTAPALFNWSRKLGLAFVVVMDEIKDGKYVGPKVRYIFSSRLDF